MSNIKFISTNHQNFIFIFQMEFVKYACNIYRWALSNKQSILFLLTLSSFTYNPNVSTIERVPLLQWSTILYRYIPYLQFSYHILNKMSSVVSIDCLWLSMTVDSTVLCKVAMKEKLWNNCYYPPSQKGLYTVYLYISQTTAHKGHVVCFPNVVSIYSTDCIFRKKTKWTKYITIGEMGVGSTGATTFDSQWKR